MQVIDINRKITEAYFSYWNGTRFNNAVTRKEAAQRIETILATIPEVAESKVVCDEQNNPPSVVDSHSLELDVFFRFEGKTYHWQVPPFQSRDQLINRPTKES